MMSLIPGLPAGKPLTVLCLGAHADDIEIGCGGTILRLLAERKRVTVHWVVMTANPVRDREARRTAARILRGAADSHVRIEHFRDGFLPFMGAEVKEVFEQSEAGGSGPHLHPSRRRCAPGPPSGVAADLEHVSRSQHPRIRDPEVRRRSRATERVCPALAGNSHDERFRRS